MSVGIRVRRAYKDWACMTSIESGQLPSGWEEFKDGEGRSYYVGPEGQSSWEIPVDESVSTLSMHKSSIRRSSVVGKRRSSMRVAAASVAKKDMG